MSDSKGNERECGPWGMTKNVSDTVVMSYINYPGAEVYGYQFKKIKCAC